MGFVETTRSRILKTCISKKSQLSKTIYCIIVVDMANVSANYRPSSGCTVIKKLHRMHITKYLVRIKIGLILLLNGWFGVAMCLYGNSIVKVC